MATLLVTACSESSAAPDAQIEAATEVPNAASSETAQTHTSKASFEEVLANYQALNERLARVAAPLRLASDTLCPNTRRDPGFTIHKLEDYPKSVRPMAEAFLGVKPGGIYVRAVRAGTSAAEARIEPGDQILAVNENPISSDRLMETYNRAVLRNGFESVLSKVKIRTASGQEFLARIRPDTACDIPTKVVFSKDINGHTDGEDVLMTSALMRSVPDDTNLALVIAHEMAHVIAGHIDQTPSQKLELEADRMALVLMARAGYDIAAAVAYWERAVHPHEGGNNTESSHPSTRARYKNFQAELKRIRKIKPNEPLEFSRK